jgi:hypothetical protein
MHILFMLLRYCSGIPVGDGIEKICKRVFTGFKPINLLYSIYL